ncbi:hypothetical protein JHV675_52720 [Mycobacterium avium subsp. hominissuis]
MWSPSGNRLSAFTRAAMAGDITASIANWGSKALQFSNADYTLTLSRLPEGDHIGQPAQRERVVGVDELQCLAAPVGDRRGDGR